MIEGSALITAVASLLGVAIVLLSGIIGWLAKKVWHIETEQIPRIESLEEQMRGAPGSDSGHVENTNERFDEIEKQLHELQSMMEEAKWDRERTHYELSSALADIIYVLEQEGFNGGLPDRDNFDSRYEDDRYEERSD